MARGELIRCPKMKPKFQLFPKIFLNILTKSGKWGPIRREMAVEKTRD